MTLATSGRTDRRFPPISTNPTRRRRLGALLWVLQILLTLLFLFAGGFKLFGPAAFFAKQTALPIAFLRFIGAVEIMGALGLVLPGVLRVRTGLTPIAAGGLVIIMSGATGASVAAGHLAPGAFPFAIGVVAGLVALGRARYAPLSGARGGSRGAPPCEAGVPMLRAAAGGV